MAALKSAIAWIDRRFPLTTFIRRELAEYPTPRKLSYRWGFGFLAGFLLVLQIVSGVFLAMHYKPDIHLAFDSVQHIMRDVNYGWLIRYIHSTGASAFFIVVYIHMARTLYYGSYRAPRELMWWSGQILLLSLMASAFMGYLLPWGQMSYWGAQVITSLFGATPLLGDEVVLWLRGDYVVGAATLNRFFALHYLVPFVIDPAIIVPSIPLQTPPHIVPEWYFLPFYAFLRAVPDTLGGVAAMTLSILIFAAMPLLDRSRIPGGARFRPIYRAVFYIFIADVMVLAYIGSQPPGGRLFEIDVAATVIYFASFLTLPLVSRWEERWLRARGLPPALQALLASTSEPMPRGQHRCDWRCGACCWSARTR